VRHLDGRIERLDQKRRALTKDTVVIDEKDVNDLSPAVVRSDARP